MMLFAAGHLSGPQQNIMEEPDPSNQIQGQSQW